MSVPSPPTEYLFSLLARLRAKEETLRADYDRQLASIRKEIEAVETTYRLASEEGTVSPRQERAQERATPVRLVPPPGGWTRALEGMTQAEALVRIAQEDPEKEHRLPVTAAKRIFLETGLATGNPKYVGPHIYHILVKSDDWKKVAPGVFQWLPGVTESDSQSGQEVSDQKDSTDTEDMARHDGDGEHQERF